MAIKTVRVVMQERDALLLLGHTEKTVSSIETNGEQKEHAVVYAAGKRVRAALKRAVKGSE